MQTARVKAQLAFIGLQVLFAAVLGISSREVVAAESGTTTLAQSYCLSFAKSAEAARESRQKAELDDLNVKLDEKLATINAKTKELERWVTERESMLAMATASILKIYDTMDAATAAQELAKLDLQTVSAVMIKMKAKKSSEVLKEMNPRMAAEIIAIISARSDLRMNAKP